MITYFISEIKDAALWLRGTIVSVFKWMFRWLLRLLLLGTLLFGFGGGCHFLSNAFRSEESKEVVGAPKATDANPQISEPERTATPYTRESQKPPMHTQVKSTWSVLSGIVRDVERFFRRR